MALRPFGAGVGGGAGIWCLRLLHDAAFPPNFAVGQYTRLYAPAEPRVREFVKSILELVETSLGRLPEGLVFGFVLGISCLCVFIFGVVFGILVTLSIQRWRRHGIVIRR